MKMQSRKPNPLQIEVAEIIRTAADYWITTNDLYSPSHFTEHSALFEGMELVGEISESQAELLSKALDDILSVIQELK